MPADPQVARLLDQLARGPVLVVDLVNDVPSDRLKRRPIPSKWSAHEHACHLAAVQPLFMSRLDLMLHAPTPVIRPYNLADDDAEDALLAVDLVTPSPNLDPGLVRESSCPLWGWKGFSDEEATQYRADRGPASAG